MPGKSTLSRLLLFSALTATLTTPATAQRTQKPVLHGKDWMAITGKPLGATAGAMMFLGGGNAVDAASAMLGATATMWDVLGWGGETQALIHNPGTGEVIGINALGAAPTGATPGFFRERDMDIPPAHGPLAAVTPGTPGGLMVMVAEYGRLSLAEVLAPSIDMARGYPIEAQAAEAANFNSYQMRSSFGAHESQPGRLLLNDAVPAWVRAELRDMGYDLTFSARTSGPINAIFFDGATGTMWGGSSNHGEDYGIAW